MCCINCAIPRRLMHTRRKFTHSKSNGAKKTKPIHGVQRHSIAESVLAVQIGRKEVSYTSLIAIFGWHRFLSLGRNPGGSGGKENLRGGGLVNHIEEFSVPLENRTKTKSIFFLGKSLHTARRSRAMILGQTRNKRDRAWVSSRDKGNSSRTPGASACLCGRTFHIR